MTIEEKNQLVADIDGDVRKIIQRRLLRGKEPAHTLEALAHALIYEGVQCATRVRSSEVDPRPFINAAVEASLKTLAGEKPASPSGN